MGKDEDATDRELDAMARSLAGKYCREWFTNKKGKQQRCTKKKGHWGKHG